MKLLVVLLTIFMGVIAVQVTASGSDSKCRTGEIKGFAIVRGDPVFGMGDIPNRWVSDGRWFKQRYNCSGGLVQVRRRDEGSYDVRFVGNGSNLAFVTGRSSIAHPVGARKFEDYFRINIRSPIVKNGILESDENPFYIMVT